jgi:methionyl-tRNA synthetase
MSSDHEPRGSLAETLQASRGQTRYITTPIYYASGHAHAGHLYTTLMAQILKDHHRAAGRNVRTLTGMDEHGEKIAEKARAAGLSPQQFVDGLKDEWQQRWKDFGLDFDIFLRTTSDEHKKNVQQIFAHCHAKGDIYFGEHEGRYCVDCEEFLTETQMDPQKNCLIHKRPTEVRKEGNYFFRTTRYRDAIRDLVESGRLTSSRRYAAELLGMLAQLNTDLSVSRPKSRTQWGIELPFDSNHVAYVWFDALPNYVTGVGGLDAARSSPYWHNALHILGKDILKFHGIYWPAMLLSLELPIPKLLVHSWLLQSGEKMSKSLGNVLDLKTIREVLGKDGFVNAVFRLAHLGDDLDLSVSLAIERYNADLANGIGNLLSRSLTLSLKAFGGRFPAFDVEQLQPNEREIFAEAQQAVAQCFVACEEGRLSDSLRASWQVIASLDRYIAQTKPWELVKGPLAEGTDEHAHASRVLGVVCAGLRVVGLLSFPFFPEKTRELLACLGEDLTTTDDLYLRALDFVPADIATRRLSAPPRLFPRKELSPADASAPTEQVATRAASAATKESAPEPAPGLPAISFEHFSKVDVRVGLVEKAEIVEGSDKLIRLEIHLGDIGVRQIFSGIRQWVRPEDLAGRKVLVAANLEPRKMRFGVSQGMLLSTEDGDGRVIPVVVSDDIEPGSRLV